MAFTKGVHRFIFNVVVNGEYTGIIPYMATDDGEWQELEDCRIYTDAFYPENFATVIKNAFNKVFDDKCTVIENTEGSVARVGIGIPNADGLGTSNFTLELSASGSYWTRGSAVTLSTTGKLRPGITISNSFTSPSTNYCNGRIAYPSGSNISVSGNTSGDIDLRYPIFMKVVITDNFYTVGMNCYSYNQFTLDVEKATFIDTNIIIGKTNTNKDYMTYGRAGSDSGYPTAGIIIKDSNEVIFQDMLSFEYPEVEQSTYAKLTPISAGGHNTGWYYAPKQYTSIYGNWNKAYTVVDKAVCIGNYLTKGIDENVFTINNKSFDALIGYFGYNYGIYREHVNNN